MEDITRLISEWVWETDTDGKFVYVSDRITEVLGILPLMVTGKTFYEIGTFITEEGDVTHINWKKPFRDVLFEARNKDGEERLFLISGIPFYDPETWEFEGITGTAEDITERRAKEYETQSARNVAELANKAKSDFLSSMSHELRTPLNAILGFGQLLGSNLAEPLSENQQRGVDFIVSGGRHLLSLIDEVLELTQIETGNIKLSIEQIELDEICQNALVLVNKSATDRRLTIERNFDPNLVIEADKTRLHQVLLNLLSNAVKYNREGGTLSLSSKDNKDGTIRISVSDTGAGIPHENREGLFEPFNRLGKEKGNIEGTGIGLTITKQLVEAMGGTIGYETIIDKGSTFWIEFASIDPSETQITSGNGSHTKTEVLGEASIKGTILYIEDNMANQELMEMIIKRLEGVNLILAQNAERGLTIALEQRPNLILMDINLPGMNGIAAKNHLGENKATRDIPVIAISADAMKNDVEKAMSAGFKAYLTKPFVVTDVIATIEKELSI